MSGALRRLAGVGLALGLLYAAACALGFALMVLAFRSGLLARIDILFYRGLVLVALAGVATYALVLVALRRLRSPILGDRDAFAATVLSLSLNLCFLVVVPVTVDRSISIFMLAEMAQRPDVAVTPQGESAIFKAVYVDRFRQIERRLKEQTVSGNVEKVGDGYRISKRGLAVVALARASAWLFDSHSGLVDPRTPASPSSRVDAEPQPSSLE